MFNLLIVVWLNGKCITDSGKHPKSGIILLGPASTLNQCEQNCWDNRYDKNYTRKGTGCEYDGNSCKLHTEFISGGYGKESNKCMLFESTYDNI